MRGTTGVAICEGELVDGVGRWLFRRDHGVAAFGDADVTLRVGGGDPPERQRTRWRVCVAQCAGGRVRVPPGDRAGCCADVDAASDQVAAADPPQAVPLVSVGPVMKTGGPVNPRARPRHLPGPHRGSRPRSRDADTDGAAACGQPGPLLPLPTSQPGQTRWPGSGTACTRSRLRGSSNRIDRVTGRCCRASAALIIPSGSCTCGAATGGRQNRSAAPASKDAARRAPAPRADRSVT